MRTLALVATRIPINPARAEQKAPTINDKPTNGDEFSSLAPEIPKRMATITTKMARILYSARRKAMAPSAIAFAIPAIRSLPSSCLPTHALFT